MPPAVNKTISTSRIFKKYHKPSKKRLPEHPLATRLDETLEKSRATISAESATALASAHANVSSYFETVTTDFEKSIANAAASTKVLTAPLAEEILEFKKEDGKKVIEVPLGLRMKRFRKIAGKEREELARLEEEWMKVNAELEAFAVEMLGVNALEILGRVALGDVGGLVNEAQKRDEEEILKEKETLEAEVEKISEESLRKMQSCEKKLSGEARKQRQMLIELCELEM